MIEGEERGREGGKKRVNEEWKKEEERKEAKTRQGEERRVRRGRKEKEKGREVHKSGQFGRHKIKTSMEGFRVIVKPLSAVRRRKEGREEVEV